MCPCSGKELRECLTDMFRNAQWTGRFTFKENEFQNSLELECRHIRPSLRLRPTVHLAEPLEEVQGLPSCLLHNGCPVAPLQRTQVDLHLGLVSVGRIDATFLRALVKFNQVKLPDEEALQQDNSATSAMRVKRSFDCLLSEGAASPFQGKLRMAGPASAVNWLLQGRAGEVHQVILAQTEVFGEWSVLWQVPVETSAVQTTSADSPTPISHGTRLWRSTPNGHPSSAVMPCETACQPLLVASKPRLWHA